MNSTNSEIGQKSNRGRKTDPNAKRFVSVGFTPEQRAYLRKWKVSPEDADNPTEQLSLLIDYARTFWPEGYDFNAGWDRDARGRFVRKKPAPET